MPDLVSESGLTKYSLQFQKTIKMLCCLECSILLISQTSLKHIHNCHAKTYEKYPKKKYEDICTLLKVQEKYPLLEDLESINALSGLKLHTMVLVCCHEGCNKLFATDGSM